MSLMDEIRKIPPVTRFMCCSFLAVSLPMKLQIVSAYKLLFVKDIVTKQFEIWRVFTSFFIGGDGFNFIFDLAMLYRYSNDLEEGHYAGRSADYAWQLLLSSGIILSLNIPLGTFVHTRALLISLVYLSSALAPAGTKTSFWGLLTIPVRYAPYLFIAMDLLMGGPSAAVVSTTGAIAGHIWWWGIWDSGVLRAWGHAPSWFRRWMGDRPDGAVSMGGGVHVVPPRRLREEAASATRTPVGAHNWGSGRRLGTD